MNKQNFPEFTAEISLSKAQTYYHFNTSKQLQQEIIPQLISRKGPWSDWCIPGCICVTQENCPCCEGFRDPRRVLRF